ncbi:hypothetical protein [Deinococcus cavernae]|uniref:hypothetical protein n=1 Tax=Deinococcus cavernae TaxID=2320857 RepID=UPI0011C241E6|nr:hypothetical protein [Deinococcus cavernae]
MNSPQGAAAKPAATSGGSVAAAGLRLGSYRLLPPLPGEKRLLTLEFGHVKMSVTRTQLLALPTATLTTRHAQLGRTFTYQGVLLRTLASAMHTLGQDMRVYGSNGYVATIAAQDYMTAPIILAHTADGKPISILEKGPLTIVLPSKTPRFEQKGDYWVWFVNRMTPVPGH